MEYSFCSHISIPAIIYIDDGEHKDKTVLNKKEGETGK
jgi:hypothetical protein